MRLRFTPNMKLELEPIPESTWGTSLAQLLPPPIWHDLRREVYAAFNHTCAICGATDKRLHCHEKWSYDDKNHIQKLAGFQCLCEDCHAIKHWGRTVAEAHKNGNSSILAVLTEHFCKVNHCSVYVFTLHKVEVGNIMQKRNKYRYRVEFGKFRPDLVEAIWKKNKK